MKRIKLTQGKVALISDRDYWLVRQFKWCAHWNGYNWYAVTATPNPHRKIISMHRLLAGFPPFDLDHKNGNSLDNQRRNLRPATRSQNNANQRLHTNNTSGHKGVSWDKVKKKWRTTIQTNKIPKHIGYFEKLQDAAAAYAKIAKKYFGEFARV